MIIKKTLILLFCIIPYLAYSQQVSVLKMSETTDFIPGDDQRRDFNNELCALVKIQVVDDVTDVEGNVMGDIISHGVEKWVYMAQGSKKMKVHLKNYLPIEVLFSNYKIAKLNSNRVYQLVLSTEAKGAKAANATKTDILEMKDLSYVECKIIRKKSGFIFFKQDGLEGEFKLPIKDVARIKYANGAQKKF